MVVSSGYLLNFKIVFIEKVDFLGMEMRLDVAVAERANFLGDHPAEVALFSSITEGPHLPLVV